MREVHQAPAESGALLPLALFAGALVMGSVGALVAYEALDLSATVIGLGPDVRVRAGLGLLALGGILALVSYGRLKNDAPGSRRVWFVAGAIGAAIVFAAAKLLMAYLTCFDTDLKMHGP